MILFYKIYIDVAMIHVCIIKFRKVDELWHGGYIYWQDTTDLKCQSTKILLIKHTLPIDPCNSDLALVKFGELAYLIK